MRIRKRARSLGRKSKALIKPRPMVQIHPRPYKLKERSDLVTKQKALELLSSAPVGDTPSRVNPGLTTKQAVDIVRAAVEDESTGDPLDRLMEKRVWQVHRNQRRPRMSD